MYSVNGVPLDNSKQGWRLMRPTQPLVSITQERVTLAVPGRPGTAAGLPAATLAPVLTFVVHTPLAGLEALQALWMHSSEISYVSNPAHVVGYELLSMTPTTFGPAMEKVNLTVTVRLAGVFWRDRAETIGDMVALDRSNAPVTAWPGSTGWVNDAIVRVRGPVTGLNVSSGDSWFSYPAEIASGQYLRFHSDTGRAFLTTTDTWSGGTEVSGAVEFDGPDGYFRIAPYFTTNPADRNARIVVTTLTRATGAVAQIRGKGAYLA